MMEKQREYKEKEWKDKKDIPSEGPNSILVNALTDLSSFTVPIIS